MRRSVVGGEGIDFVMSERRWGREHSMLDYDDWIVSGFAWEGVTFGVVSVVVGVGVRPEGFVCRICLHFAFALRARSPIYIVHFSTQGGEDAFTFCRELLWVRLENARLGGLPFQKEARVKNEACTSVRFFSLFSLRSMLAC